MRSHNRVNVGQSVRQIVAHVQWIRAFLFLAATASIVAFSAHAQEGNSGASKPRIVDFTVTFDGFDQFYVSGKVVDVESPDGLTVEFGDYLSGLTTQTEYGGYFGMLFVSSDGEYETFSAIVKSHEGVESDPARYWIW